MHNATPSATIGAIPSVYPVVEVALAVVLLEDATSNAIISATDNAYQVVEVAQMVGAVAQVVVYLHQHSQPQAHSAKVWRYQL